MNQVIDGAGTRSRIVVVGAGYADYHCARHLERSLPREAAEIVIVSPADYMPYTSLLPEVGAGTLDPRHIAVSLSATLWRTCRNASLSASTCSQGWCESRPAPPKPTPCEPAMSSAPATAPTWPAAAT